MVNVKEIKGEIKVTYYKNCKCKGWKENNKIIDSALMNYTIRGFGKLKNSFEYCPYCGKKLILEKSE